MNGLRTLMLTASVLLGAAMPVRAQINGYADLGVCNKGTVPVEVVAATKNVDLLRGFDKYYWRIEGTAVAPGKCAKVYHDTDAGGAYLAFGFADAKGQWGSGTSAQVPDLGTHLRFFREYPVMRSAAKGVCARRDETERYRLDDDPQTDCAGLQVPGNARQVAHGPLLPLTAALYFEPEGTSCAVVNSQSVCNYGDYHLNISPSATDRELHAVRGRGDGADAPPVDNATTLKNLAAAIAKAVAEDRQRQQQAEADAKEAQLRQLQEQAAARVENQKKILAAAAAGKPGAKVEAQIIQREAESNRQRWAGTRQSPAAYDPQWVGQNVTVVGTVSRVEIDSSGSPQWVSIYFKESPDATFVVCSPAADLFQERVGLNLSALVGKTMEAAGAVESPRCGNKTSKGSIRVLVSTQWQVH